MNAGSPFGSSGAWLARKDRLLGVRRDASQRRLAVTALPQGMGDDLVGRSDQRQRPTGLPQVPRGRCFKPSLAGGLWRLWLSLANRPRRSWISANTAVICSCC
jgi:hypothetical protein